MSQGPVRLGAFTKYKVSPSTLVYEVVENCGMPGPRGGERNLEGSGWREKYLLADFTQTEGEDRFFFWLNISIFGKYFRLTQWAILHFSSLSPRLKHGRNDHAGILSHM